MSRQSKARAKAVLAKQYSKTRKEGGHGPSKTAPKHTKERAKRWFFKRDNPHLFAKDTKKTNKRNND
jgi:hypothetical protein